MASFVLFFGGGGRGGKVPTHPRRISCPPPAHKSAGGCLGVGEQATNWLNTVVQIIISLVHISRWKNVGKIYILSEKEKKINKKRKKVVQMIVFAKKRVKSFKIGEKV